MHDKPDASRDPFDLLGQLPIHDLEPGLSDRLRERAHVRLARARRSGTVGPALAPALARALEFAVAGLLAVGNLAWAVLRSLELLT